MKPPPFTYTAPNSIEEAVALLRDYGDEAKVLAGGQSLTPLLSFRLADPTYIIDLNRIPGLGYVEVYNEKLIVGALARHRQIEDMHKFLMSQCPLILEAVRVIGHTAIRNRGTVCGSIAHADPAAEWPLIAVALDAEVDAAGPEGTRTIAAQNLFESFFTTALRPTEIVTEARFNLPKGSTGTAFMEVSRRHGDFAIAGVGAVLTLNQDGVTEDARVMLLGLSDAPLRATSAEERLIGRLPTDELVEEAMAAADHQMTPVTDVHGSADYRRHLAYVLGKRVLVKARERTSGSESK